ncbi:hypothetical protein I4U23_016641 [Adineta vaga]|nr:hypothetical protein I4U23_016641 [Adineta vaga]
MTVIEHWTTDTHFEGMGVSYDILQWFYRWIHNYNLFIPDEDEYDNEDTQTINPEIILKHQIYTTRIYISLLIVFLYILFVIALVFPQTRVVTIEHITPIIFNKLQNEHGETLSFLFHPLCSSNFVSEKWIRALYLSYSSIFLIEDFRTTASFQFKLLAALCSLSKRIVSQALIELDNTQLITIQLLSENNVRSQINGNVGFTQSIIPSQIIIPVRFLQITTISNSLISALNTNIMVRAIIMDRSPLVEAEPTIYYNTNDPDGRYFIAVCGHFTNSISPAGFYSSLSFYESAENHQRWCNYAPFFEPIASSMVNGFFGGCIPLNAVLEKAWTIEINYSTYFTKCAPKFCTYTETNQVNFVYTITLLIGLYGGLTIILQNNIIYSRKFIIWIKQLNIFKSANERRDIDIKRQRIITRIYFILLASSVTILILFTSFDTHFASITVQNPSITAYKNLQKLYSTSLICPCKNVSIPYNTFISLSPILHQVCTSDFVTLDWILMLLSIESYVIPSLYIPWIWRGLDGRHFMLLLLLCEFSENAIIEIIYRFGMRLFVTSNVLTETEFNIQLNTTFKQFIQPLIVQFELIINTTHLFTQVDQPYTDFGNARLVGKPSTDDQFTFDLTGVKNTNSTSVDCICATNPNCQSTVALYGWNSTENDDLANTLPYFVPAFGSNMDRIQAKRLGQYATRLYIVLFIISITILGLSTIVQPQILTKTFVKPSLNLYRRLVVDYAGTLQCFCSLISSPYERFIEIKSEFHQICSSQFVSDEWRTNLVVNLVSNLSTYDVLDYRRFLSAHLQLLTGLCALSIQSVDDAIVQFLSSNFITVKLMSQTIFDENINLLIKQSKSNAPIAFVRFINLLREINQGNAIVSTYYTNFKYIAPYYMYGSFGTPLITEAINYDNNCSCALDENCTTQAVFILTDSSRNISIKGLKMGCTPKMTTIYTTTDDLQSISTTLLSRIMLFRLWNDSINAYGCDYHRSICLSKSATEKSCYTAT